MPKTRKPVDNLPWYERAGRQFVKFNIGTHTVTVTGEPTDEYSEKFKRWSVAIPTTAGVLSSGSFALLGPLAVYRKKKGKVAGATLKFTVKGTGKNKTYEAVTVR